MALLNQLPTRSRPSAAASIVDDRRDTRYRIRLPVVMSYGKRWFPLQTRDVSFAGLFVEADHLPAERQLIRLQLVLPPSWRIFDAHGMAIHKVPQQGMSIREAGFGVQLYALDRVNRVVWDDFIGHMREQLRRGEISGDVVRNAPLRESVNPG